MHGYLFCRIPNAAAHAGCVAHTYSSSHAGTWRTRGVGVVNTWSKQHAGLLYPGLLVFFSIAAAPAGCVAAAARRMLAHFVWGARVVRVKAARRFAITMLAAPEPLKRALSTEPRTIARRRPPDLGRFVATAEKKSPLSVHIFSLIELTHHGRANSFSVRMHSKQGREGKDDKRSRFHCCEGV